MAKETQRPTSNEGHKVTVEALLERIEVLEKQPPTSVTLTDSGDAFEREVWKAVLVGAVTALFDPSRMPLDNRPDALTAYLNRALKTAETAALTAKNYRKQLDLQKKEDIKEPDPLKSLLSSTSEDL